MVLENQSFDVTFGDKSDAAYLRRLATGKEDQGDDRAVLLDRYYGVGHNSLDNYIAMISGQAPNLATQRDCPVFADMPDFAKFSEEKLNKIRARLNELSDCPTKKELEDTETGLGIGCVYPDNIRTVADQFEAHNPPLLWRAYMEDMPDPCAHPAIGQVDETRHPKGPPRYVVRHNPFVYFHSLLDKGEPSSCKKNDVPLGDIDGNALGLVRDLDNGKEPFPNLVFISPNLCNDGHDACADKDGNAVPELKEIDLFLQKWVPKIRASKPYKDDGMLIITFDEGEVWSCKKDRSQTTKNQAASESCCGEKPGLFAVRPGIYGPGGGRIGAVILSPLLQPGAHTNSNEFNHYSMLRSIEDMFGIHEHLGGANEAQLQTFQQCGVFKSGQ